MKRITLNIGVNGIEDNIETILSHIEAHPIVERLSHYYVDQSEWKGKPETTLVVGLTSNIARTSTLIAWIENMCTQWNQDAIAIKINGIGYLVYDYRIDNEENPPQPFVEEYFLA